jgi:hypothetical protein
MLGIVPMLAAQKWAPIIGAGVAYFGASAIIATSRRCGWPPAGGLLVQTVGPVWLLGCALLLRPITDAGR